ncbi:MAG: DUF3048 domain-containing protein, partial [Lapillicoccus sp.]
RRRLTGSVLRALAGPALGLAVAAACASPPPSPAAPAATTATGIPTSTTPAPTTAPVPPTTSSPAPAAPSAPALASLPVGTVLAVKIDNTAGSRPRLGVDHAVAVYVEPVEGGLTRVMAVFSTAAPGGLPADVGPIRSARESDVMLLASWGHIALAYSGGSAFTRSVVDAADLATLSYEASSRGYRRAGDRTAPYNVIGSTATLLARAGTGPTPSDPGFRFGPPSAGGTPATSVSTAWPAASVRLDWDAGSRTYLVTTDGRPDIDADGARHAAATVVIQKVPTHLSDNRDVNGAQTPVMDLVGQGPAVVLRDGQQWTAQWSRPQASAPTAYTANGQPVAMASGPVWVLFVPDGQAVTIG